MVKKISTLAIAAILAIPVAAHAGAGGVSNTELDAKIEQLTRDFQKQITELHAQMEEQKETITSFEEESEEWGLASRFQWSGDIRNRIDFHTADTATYYKATDVGTGVQDFVGFGTVMDRYVANNPAADVNTFMGDWNGTTTLADGVTTLSANELAAGQRIMAAVMTSPLGAALGGFGTAPIGAVSPTFTNIPSLTDFMKTLSATDRKAVFAAMGYNPTPAATYDNDTQWTTRLRLNLRVKATEDVEIKARIVGYKAWGMQDSPTPEQDLDGVHNTDSPYFLNSRSFDGTTGRQPGDNKLLLDRAFMNWNNIGGAPVWFSIGRRPTTDGPPNHLRMNSGGRMATTIAYMDYPFDGISLGYAYENLGSLTDAPGRIRFCYGRGFEAGPNPENTGMSDVDFAGINWDVYKKGNRFFNIQSFGAFGIFNVPGDTYFPNPLELAQEEMYTGSTDNQYLDRINMGNIFQTAAVYMDRYQNLNYFVTGGWSRTDAKATDEMGITLLGDFWAPPEAKNGYNLFVGARYDMPDLGLKIGAEYNHGTKNWLPFTPGHDDMYSSKLATRGNVYEVYGIYDIPAGDAISKYGKAFIRLGYQHYDYNYTYSGMWLGTPTKIEDIQNDPLSAQFYAPIESMDQVYLTLEASF
ncbi:MAG: DUF3373 family protein [Thermodesulfobacteriota bacterium]